MPVDRPHGGGLADDRAGAEPGVVRGQRAGAARFNQRGSDPGPAPMGIVLIYERPKKQ